MKNNKGFTLVEMLVVVVIIAILMGVTIRITNAGKGTNEKAVTLLKLEKLRMAIEEYRAEHGRYPPVDGGQTMDMFEDNLLGSDSYQYTISFAMPHPNYTDGLNSYVTTDGNPIPGRPTFTMGLLSHLMPRTSCEGRYDNQSMMDANMGERWTRHTYWTSFTRNPERDERFWQKIKPYVDDIIEPQSDTSIKSQLYAVPFFGFGEPPEGYKPLYFLREFYVKDGWGARETIRYRSDPPYTTYRLWCQRPDGTIVEGHVGF